MQRSHAPGPVTKELRNTLNLMSIMHDAACICARVAQDSTSNEAIKLLHGSMALLFHGLASAERRSHELAAINADNPAIRAAAFSTVANRSLQAGKGQALPSDVLTLHKVISDDASKSQKRSAPMGRARSFGRGPKFARVAPSNMPPRPPPRPEQ